MIRKAANGILLVSFLLSATVSIAQNLTSTKDSELALKGLGSIKLAIDIDDEAETCGITRDLIRDAFMFPVSQTKLKVSERSTDPVFFVGVLTLVQRSPRQCITSLTMSVVDFDRLRPRYRNEGLVPVTVVFWQDGALRVGGDASRHAEQIRNAIDRSTKRFLTSWAISNR